MKKKSAFLASIVAGGMTLLGLASQSNAAVIITLDNVSVPAGSTALVGVYASSTTGDIISGFNLPLDINDDGLAALPTGFSYASPDLLNVLYANTGLDTPQPQISLIGVDSIPTGSGANVQLSTTPTLLFDLAINVAGSVPGGTVVPLEIEIPAAPYSPLFNVAGPSDPAISSPAIGTPANGSITVISVPEPSAVFLVAVALIAIPFRSRSRRSAGSSL